MTTSDTFIDAHGVLFVAGEVFNFDALREQGTTNWGSSVLITKEAAVGIADLVQWLRERVPNHVPTPDAASSLAGVPGSAERAFNEAEGDRSE